MEIQKEVTVSNYRGKTIWMSYMLNGSNKLLFTDRERSLGTVDFGDDAQLCEATFNYLSDRFPNLSNRKVYEWVKKLTGMSGKRAFLYLVSYGREVTRIEVLNICKRLGMSTMNLGDTIMVANTEESEYFCEFTLKAKGYKFSFLV